MAKPIKIEIVGDTKSIKSAFGEVEQGTSNLTKGLATVATAIAGSFVVDKIVDFGTEMFSLASDLQNSTKKISTVFGDQEADIRAWADSVNESFGVSATGVELLTANVADLIKPMGATTDEAANMSKEIVGLAPALAQWSAGQYDASEVSEILAKSLLGERDQLKSLGISISQAEVDQRALELAQKDGRDAATSLDDALATQQLIFEKSTDAQAGFTAGAETLTGQQAELQAKMAELKEFIALKLTPVFLEVGQVVVNDIVPALQDFWAKVQDLRPTLEAIGDRVMPTIRDVAKQLASGFQTVSKFVQDHDSIMRGLKITLIGVGVALAAVAAIIAVSIAAGIAIFAALAVAVGAVVGAVASLVSTLQQQGSKIYNAITGPFGDAIKWVTDKWQALKDKLSLGISVPNPLKGLGGVIPGLATGGVSMGGVYTVGERGREQVYLPQGARVTPAHTGRSSGGDTYNIQGYTMSPAELAREIAWKRRVGDGR